MPDEQAPDMYQDVLEFHKKFVPNQMAPLPMWPRFDVMRLRGKLIQEEMKELVEAFDDADFEGIVDGSLDLIYVVLGTLVAMGVDARPVWNEIQKANMAKEGGPMRPDGKVLKPEGWMPPDIVGVLSRQTPIETTLVAQSD